MPELTVASTTDTDADVKRAANVPVEAEQPQTEASEEQQPELEQRRVAKSSYQKRLDQMRRAQGDAERKAAALEERLKQLETKAGVSVPHEPTPQAEVPTGNDYAEWRKIFKPKEWIEEWSAKNATATFEDAVAAMNDFLDDKRQEFRAQAEAKRDWEAQRQETVTAYNRQVTEFKKEHADFDQVIGKDITLPQVALDTIVELANPAIAYYLAQHPEVCDELNDNVNRPGWVAARVGQIAAQVGMTTAEEVTEGESEESPVRRSAAPPPIKPVGGSATRSSVPLDEMPYSEYRKIRDRQAQERFRR
jgi:hypothetical protein